MNHLPTGLTIATLLAGALMVSAIPGAGANANTNPVLFGMDSAGVAAQSAAGVAPDYGTFWVGPWTLSSGWAGPDGQLTAMKNAGVTPAIHFYYWGDDITPSCVENGCWSSLHNAQKTRAGWEELGTQLTSHLNSKMGGAPVVIFLESEFNKGGIETYEPFDGYMAAMANKIHQGYPNAIVVLGFGNWGSHAWGTFDRAAAASDMVGVQGMRGSTRQSQTDMYTLYDGLLTGVKSLETKFPNKPIMLTDIAVSSYPEPQYLQVQADVLAEVFANLDVLKAHGVEAMIYRSWKDSSKMDLANYYGQAERHWGLAYDSSGVHKAAAKVWIDGVKAERNAVAPNNAPVAAFSAAGSDLVVNVDASASSDPDGNALTYAWTFGDGATATGKTATHTYAAGTYTIGLTVSDGRLSSSASRTITASQPPPADFTATFVPKGNEWWVEAQVTGNQAIAKVEAKAGSGAYVTLPKTDWGSYAKSFHVPKGTPVTFRATATDGQVEVSETKPWLGATTTTSSTTTSSAPASSDTFTATFVPKGNEWWVEAKVTGDQAIAKVEAKAGSGAYVTLPKTDWGAYAKSFNVPKGTPVTFRATATDGQVEVSETKPWLGATTTTSSTTTSSAPAFKATFAPKSQTNNWWVESGVTANGAITKVEAKVNSGAYVTLPKTDWGTYAKSINAPDGSKVTFRATTTSGATSSSVAYTWG